MWLYRNDYNIRSNGKQSWQYRHTAVVTAPWDPADWHWIWVVIWADATRLIRKWSGDLEDLQAVHRHTCGRALSCWKTVLVPHIDASTTWYNATLHQSMPPSYDTTLKAALHCTVSALVLTAAYALNGEHVVHLMPVIKTQCGMTWSWSVTCPLVPTLGHCDICNQMPDNCTIWPSYQTPSTSGNAA